MLSLIRQIINTVHVFQIHVFSHMCYQRPCQLSKQWLLRADLQSLMVTHGSPAAVHCSAAICMKLSSPRPTPSNRTFYCDRNVSTCAVQWDSHWPPGPAVSFLGLSAKRECRALWSKISNYFKRVTTEHYSQPRGSSKHSALRDCAGHTPSKLALLATCG